MKVSLSVYYFSIVVIKHCDHSNLLKKVYFYLDLHFKNFGVHNDEVVVPKSSTIAQNVVQQMFLYLGDKLTFRVMTCCPLCVLGNETASNRKEKHTLFSCTHST